MTGGLLEYEVRRLPDVLAAMVDDDAVTVLVPPTADADAVHTVITAMLATAGDERTVTVLGGTSTLDIRRRRLVPVGVGAVTGVGLLASAAAAAALSGALPFVAQDAPPPPTVPPVASAAPAPTAGRPKSERVIVPGSTPEWALTLPALPLPSAPAQVDAAVELVAAPVTPRRRKTPLASPPITTSTVPAVTVEPVTVEPEPAAPVLLAALPSIPSLDVPSGGRGHSGPRVDEDDDPKAPPAPPAPPAPTTGSKDDDGPDDDGPDDGDRHRNDRGQGHHEHGNGKGKGHGAESAGRGRGRS